MNYMKNRKNIIFAVLLSGAMMSLSAFADGKREPDFSRLAEKLALDDVQKEKFVSVMSAQREKRQAMMEQHREETLSSLEGVLSEEQLAQFKARMERKQKKFKGKKMGHKNCH